MIYSIERKHIYKLVQRYQRGLYSYNIPKGNSNFRGPLSLRYYIGKWTVPQIESSLLFAFSELPEHVMMGPSPILLYEGIADVVTNPEHQLAISNLYTLEEVKLFWQNPDASFSSIDVVPVHILWKHTVLCTQIKLLKMVRSYELPKL